MAPPESKQLRAQFSRPPARLRVIAKSASSSAIVLTRPSTSLSACHSTRLTGEPAAPQRAHGTAVHKGSAAAGVLAICPSPLQQTRAMSAQELMEAILVA